MWNKSLGRRWSIEVQYIGLSWALLFSWRRTVDVVVVRFQIGHYSLLIRYVRQGV